MKGTDRLKITYISQAPLEGSGVGGGARVKSIVNIFKRMNFKIDFISYSFYSNKFGIEHKELNQFLQTSTVHTPNNLPRFLKALTIFPVFVYAWKSCKNSDIIFADFNNIIASMPAIALGKIFHKPIILDCIDTKLFKIIPCNIYKYIAKNADALFAISHYLVESLKREYNCKNVVYVPIFVDTNCFKMDMKAREKIREKLRIKKNEAVIGYAGSFAYYEGVPILLQAFKNLTKKYPKIKLAIIGKIFWPNNDADIPKLIKHLNLKDRAILIPSQPHEEVPKFLSAFDILCCPKIDCEINRVANPVKVVEYLSTGLPIVCSAVGGIIDTIEDGVDGILVKPGDVKDLERKLEWVILNPERAKEIGENGRKKAIEKCSYEAIENTIKESITEIIARKRKR